MLETKYFSKLIIYFLTWYFMIMPKKILKRGLDYIRVVWVLFSFSFLIKTLFSFWKNQAFAYPTRGFNIVASIQIFVMNTVSRFFGAVIRSIVILVGLILLILVLVLTILAFLLWLLWPLLIIFWVQAFDLFATLFKKLFFSPSFSPSNFSNPSGTKTTSPSKFNF